MYVFRLARLFASFFFRGFFFRTLCGQIRFIALVGQHLRGNSQLTSNEFNELEGFFIYLGFFFNEFTVGMSVPDINYNRCRMVKSKVLE